MCNWSCGWESLLALCLIWLLNQHAHVTTRTLFCHLLALKHEAMSLDNLAEGLKGICGEP